MFYEPFHCLLTVTELNLILVTIQVPFMVCSLAADTSVSLAKGLQGEQTAAMYPFTLLW